jgi:hypothetical protein
LTTSTAPPLGNSPRTFLVAAIRDLHPFHGLASAATTDDCQAEIAELRTDTATIATLVNAKDRTGLLGLLDNASAALAAGRTPRQRRS